MRSVWKAQGADRAQCLTAFHAFTGADNNGRFAEIGKATWFGILTPLKLLSQRNEVTEVQLSDLERVVCADNIPELRWDLLCKRMI